MILGNGTVGITEFDLMPHVLGISANSKEGAVVQSSFNKGYI
jgi:uncharacterized membrane protein YuzA (DUF378 family)